MKNRQAPQKALARASDIRAIFETELQDHSPSGWVPRAILDRYLSWLMFFGEEWLYDKMTIMFPTDDKEHRDAAWLGHLQNNGRPIGKLVSALHRGYAEHIASLARGDAPPGYEERIGSSTT